MSLLKEFIKNNKKGYYRKESNITKYLYKCIKFHKMNLQIKQCCKCKKFFKFMPYYSFNLYKSFESGREKFYEINRHNFKFFFCNKCFNNKIDLYNKIINNLTFEMITYHTDEKDEYLRLFFLSDYINDFLNENNKYIYIENKFRFVKDKINLNKDDAIYNNYKVIKDNNYSNTYHVIKCRLNTERNEKLNDSE